MSGPRRAGHDHRRVSTAIAVLALALGAACSSPDRAEVREPAAATTSPPTTHGPAVATRGGPVPPGFVALDSSWIDGATGWTLGAAPCALPPCTFLVTTTDGARSWVGLPAPAAAVPGFGPRGSTVDCSSQPCVSHVRFADARNGYAFGPSLFVTGDGGRSWTREGSRPVAALETAGGRVVRVVTETAGCPPGRTYRVELGVAYVAGRARGVLVSRDGGTTWEPTLAVPAADGPQDGWFLGFQDERTARATFADGSTWTTSDGALTWDRREFTG